MHWKKLICTVVAAGLFLAGCAPTPAGQPTAQSEVVLPSAALTAFHTPLPTASATPQPPGTPTPLPSPTPTPRTHTVARGEDMGGIAYRYQITLAELMAANPNVNPNAMSIGTVLVIPGNAPSATDAAPLPTADGSVLLGPVNCTRQRDSGVWCFVLASNPSENDYESVSALIRIASPDGSESSTQTAAAGLNLLPGGAELGLAVYFPAPVPQPLAASAELASSFPRTKDDGRYLKVKIENQQVEIAPDGLSARLHGELVLSGKKAANQLRVAATAFSDQKVVGTRRWDQDEELAPGQRATFDFTLYSTGLPIERVELLAEARP